MQPVCAKCGSARKEIEHECSKCGGLFDLRPDMKYRDRMEFNFPYIEKWLSLGEVTTPLVVRGDLSLKLDYFSPTFSYKDRGARSMVSFMNSERSFPKPAEINEDSSGNAGAAISAYGTAASMKVNIFVPDKTSPAKIRQIRSYGANIVKVSGSREDVQIAAQSANGVYASHVMMPEFRDGIRTLSYEIFNQFNGMVPENIFLPVSAGTLLLGVHSGFRHLLDSGEIRGMPNIVAVQTEQVSPLHAALAGREFDATKKVNSIADALVSMKPPLLDMMVGAMSGGTCITVSENEIMEAWKALSGTGIFAEYSSATVFAAYKKKRFKGKSLLVLTGNGLKNVS